MKLPKKLFVRVECDVETSYLVADKNLYNLVEKGEKIQIGIYQLIETTMAETIVSTSKPIKESK